MSKEHILGPLLPRLTFHIGLIACMMTIVNKFHWHFTSFDTMKQEAIWLQQKKITIAFYEHEIKKYYWQLTYFGFINVFIIQGNLLCVSSKNGATLSHYCGTLWHNYMLMGRNMLLIHTGNIVSNSLKKQNLDSILSKNWQASVASHESSSISVFACLNATFFLSVLLLSP